MSNIYLNEFDRFISHSLRPSAYMRYGDDWLCFAKSEQEMKKFKIVATKFLNTELKLATNPKIDHFGRVRKGASYLGLDIWPHGRRLLPSVSSRVTSKANLANSSSYRELVKKYQKSKRLKEFDCLLFDLQEVF